MDDSLLPASNAAAELAIADTIGRYAKAVDRRDWTMLAGCFTEDAAVTFRGYNEYASRNAVVEGCRRSLTRFIQTRHLLGECDVSLAENGTEATSACDVIATHLRAEPDGPASRFTLGGRYTDRLELHDGRWLISARVLDQEWTAGDPRAMRLG